MRRPLRLALLLAAFGCMHVTAAAQDGAPPAPAEPQPAEPAPQDPAPADPAPADPAPAEPAPTEPAPTDPAPADPAPAEPAPAEPAPAEPAPAEEEHPTEETHPTEEPADPAPTGAEPATAAEEELPPDPADNQPDLVAVPEMRPLPDDPKGSIRKSIGKALEAYFAGLGDINEGLLQQRALIDLVKAVGDWREDEDGNDPLRSVDWWKAMADEWSVAGDKAPKQGKGINAFKWKTPWGDTVPIVYSTPRDYRDSEPPYPVIVTVLDKDDFGNPKKSLERLYGDLLDSHLLVATSAEFVADDHRAAMFGVMFAYLNLRTDRHRYIVDGVGEGAAAASFLAADSAVQFAAAILRAPADQGLLNANYGLIPVLAVAPENVTAPIQAGLTAVREHAGDLTLVEDPTSETGLASLVEWVQARTPRAYAQEGATFAWTAVSDGPRPQRWGYWFVVRQIVAAADDIDVRVEYRVDREHNLIDLVCENVSELTLLLNDRIVDLDHPVEVRVNGIQVTRSKAVRSIETMLNIMSQAHRSMVVTAQLPVTITGDARTPRPQREAEARMRAAQERAAREAEEAGGTLAPDGDEEGAPEEDAPEDK